MAELKERDVGGGQFGLAGRVALVTGAGRGMGRAVARAYASAGARVGVQDIELEVAREVVEAIRAEGGVATAFEGDVTEAGFAERLYGEVAGELGGVDVLVNNAAVQERADWMTVGVERLEWQWRGNVVTPWMLTRACVPHMLKRKWGRVVMLSSVQGRRGYVGMLGYSTTKAAIDNMVTALARELGPEGITVNAIAPGYFDTHRNAEDFPDEPTKRERGKWIPLGRVGEPEDVVGAALLLASDAGGYITGQVLYVDGGLSLR